MTATKVAKETRWLKNCEQVKLKRLVLGFVFEVVNAEETRIWSDKKEKGA